MRGMYAVVALAALAAIACQNAVGPVTPTAPEESGPVESGPVASVATCPCWDAATIGSAFPAVHYFRDVDGTAALTRFDLVNAQQIQGTETLAARMTLELPGVRLKVVYEGKIELEGDGRD